VARSRLAESMPLAPGDVFAGYTVVRALG